VPIDAKVVTQTQKSLKKVSCVLKIITNGQMKYTKHTKYTRKGSSYIWFVLIR
jgi:hypothetical protein